jgi:chromosome segregation ATPase
MADEISMGEMVGQKLPHDLEMIVATFLPNLKYLESRFDRNDLNIKDMSIEVKDSNNRLGALEKRFDYFEVQVDKRFDLLTGELRDFKSDSNRRFDQIGNEFRDFKGDVKQRFDDMGNEFKDFKVDVKQRFDKMGNEFKDFKGEVKQHFEQVDKRFENVDRRFDQIAASIERLGDKLDVRDARQRSFTMRMFGIAISMSFLGVLGVLIKTFGVF